MNTRHLLPAGPIPALSGISIRHEPSPRMHPRAIRAAEKIGRLSARVIVRQVWAHGLVLKAKRDGTRCPLAKRDIP